MQAKYHNPVMLKEIIDYLELSPGKTIVDATVGTAGHSLAILNRINPGGRLVAIDRDNDSLAVAKERIKVISSACDFVHSNFSKLHEILEKLNIELIDGIIFDLGISSYQLDNPQRGFSFQYEGPLDMRLDRGSYISAYDLINNLTEKEISSLIWSFGQERFHNRIARFLIEERKRAPITTTRQLSDIIFRAVPQRFRYSRIHPATRTFQAIRIAVNREIEVIEGAISQAIACLRPGGTICVISFHSLEDRAVKISFKKAQKQGQIEIITRKPERPSSEEVQNNPSSRSAKLRVARRI